MRMARSKNTATAGSAMALPLRLLLVTASLTLLGGVLVTLARVPREPALDSYRTLVVGWLAAVTLMGLAFCSIAKERSPPAALRRLRALISAHRAEFTLALGILLVGGLLRLWALGEIPPILNGDEASIGIDVQHILDGTIRDPFGLMWGPLPTMSGFVIAAFYRFFGETTFALRLPGALAGTLGIGALYLLARGFLRREVALGAALLLATLPVHIHYSRIAVNTAWDSLLFPGALAALYWAIRREGGSMPLFLTSGLLGGFAQYAYSGSRLLPALMLGVLLAHAVFQPRRLSGKWIGILAMATLLLITASPLFLHAWRYPDDFNARFHQTGIFQTGFVEQEKLARGTTTVGVLVEQTKRALLGFAYLPDNTETWGAWTPLVPALLSVALFIGLPVSLRNWRRPFTALIHGWFWSVLILAGALTLHPPTSNRLTSMMPVVALFAALGLDWAATAISRPDSGAFGPRRQRWLFTALLLATAAHGVFSYRRFLSNNNYGGTNAKIANFIGGELAERPSGTSYIALTTPQIFAGISPIVFQAPAVPGKDYVTPLTALPVDLPEGDLMVVALPERRVELNVFQQAFGTPPVSERRDPRSGEVLYYSLWIDR